jgi:hypothetical protein
MAESSPPEMNGARRKTALMQPVLDIFSSGFRVWKYEICSFSTFNCTHVFGYTHKLSGIPSCDWIVCRGVNPTCTRSSSSLWRASPPCGYGPSVSARMDRQPFSLAFFPCSAWHENMFSVQTLCFRMVPGQDHCASYVDSGCCVLGP